MHTKIVTIACLLSLAISASARADTYTWAGDTGNFSDPDAWSGPVPTPNGSPTDQLLFPVLLNNGYTATIDSSSPWLLNSLSFGLPNDNDQSSITINSTSTASLQFQGPNPTISATTYYPDSITVPISTSSDLTFAGNTTVTLSGPLSSSGPNAQLIITSIGGIDYQNNTAPTGFADTLLNAPYQFAPTIQWSYNVPNSTPVTLSFGQGPLILDGGTFSLSLSTPANIPSVTATLTNPIIVRTGSGVLNAETPSTIPLENVTYSGNILLGGTLFVTNDRGTADAQSTFITVSNTITLDQSNSNELDFGNDGDPYNQTTLITGNIVDDPDPTHTQRKPLHLYGDDTTGTFTIAGTNNTYSTGTIIDYNTVTVAPNSRLGTGNVTVNYAILRLTSPSNLAPGSTVLLAYDNDSTLSITFDASPASLLDPTTTGILALDTTFTTPLDMSTLGSGLMELGSTNNSTYAASTLAPGIDNTYRFATLNDLGYLTLLHSVLTDYNNIPSHANLANIILAAPNSYSGGTLITGNVYANASSSLGTGNISVGQSPFSDPGGTTLFLNAPNAYNPSAQVDVYAALDAIGPTGSIPFSPTPPILHPGSALVLGDALTNNSDRYPDSMPINLNSATLVLKGFGVTSETVGPLSISGVSTIVLWNPGSFTLPNPNSTTLISPSLSQAPHAVLFYVTFHDGPSYPTTTLQPDDSADGDTLLFTSAPPTTNGMVAPWIQSRGVYYYNPVSLDAPSFLNYTPIAGLIPATYTPLPTTGGTSTEIVNIPADPNNIPATLLNNTSIYALRIANSLLNPANSANTLRITSGGLIATASPFRTDPLLIQPNIDFATTEAFINVDSLLTNGTNDLQITGTLTATHGITKVGFGTLTLSNPNNQISGPLTILEGTLELASLPEPNSTDPITLTNSGNLNFLNSTILTRPIVINNQISFDYEGTEISSSQSLTIAAPITSPSTFRLSAATILNIQTPLTSPTSMTLQAPEVHLAANLSSAYVDFETYNGGRLTGNSVITSTQLTYFGGGTIAPGNVPGDLGSFTFNTPQLDLIDGATLELDLSPSGLSDHLFVTGIFSLNDPNVASDLAPTTLSLNFLSPPTNQIYTLISASSISGTFDTVIGLPANYSLDYTPTSLLLIPNTSSPEPTSLFLLTLALPVLTRRPHTKEKN